MMPFASSAPEFRLAIISDFDSLGAAFVASRTDTTEKRSRRKNCTGGVGEKKTASDKNLWSRVFL